MFLSLVASSSDGLQPSSVLATGSYALATGSVLATSSDAAMHLLLVASSYYE